MLGTVQSKTLTQVIGGSSDTFDVVLVLSGVEPIEFRITTYEEKVACNFSKIGVTIDIEISDNGRLKTLIAPHMTYTNR